MCSLAVVLWITAEIEPRSMTAQFAVSGAGGFMCALTGLLGLIGMVDVLINDFLPDRYQWRTARKNRHFVLVAIAFCYIASLYVSLETVKSTALSLFYTWNAISLLSLAFVDAYTRNKESANASPRFSV
jgi:hypothetical protein